MNDKDLKLIDAELKKRVLHALAHQSSEDEYLRAARVFERILREQDARLLTDQSDEYLQVTRRRAAEIQERILYALTQKTRDEVKLAMSLTLKAIEAEASIAASKRQSRSAAKRRENLEARDCWIRQQYADAKKNKPRYSIAQLRRDLMKSRRFRKELRPKGKFLTAERLRTIVSER
ncbi:MAG: hypothetical protein WAN12_18800 [Candidatus Acidiferrum sp.]